MASTHPELAEITVKAAQWLVDTREPFDEPIFTLLKRRFGLSQVQAMQALFEATYAIAIADGLSHEGAFRAALAVLFSAGLQPDAAMDRVRRELAEDDERG
jgi:hypothetical protein